MEKLFLVNNIWIYNLQKLIKAKNLMLKKLIKLFKIILEIGLVKLWLNLYQKIMI